MVSFQCDGCSDVVKKPKLDQHYERCHASVSCIDCSKTFHSPAEFKGHSSCISEAEKYQGDLYQGVKHGDQRWNKNVRGGSRGHFNGRGRGVDGRGGFQGRPQGRPYRGSGANGIELGAKVRSFGASPASSPHSASPAPNTAEAALKEKDKQDTEEDDKGTKNYKNKETPDATTTAKTPSDNPDAVLKKSKKRKAIVEPSSEASPSSGGTDPTEPKKKKKKDRSVIELSSAEAVPPTIVATGEPSSTLKEKSKKKDKKNKEGKTLKVLGVNPEILPTTEKLEKPTKRDTEKGGVDPIPKKKSKKSKSSAAES